MLVIRTGVEGKLYFSNMFSTLVHRRLSGLQRMSIFPQCTFGSLRTLATSSCRQDTTSHHLLFKQVLNFPSFKKFSSLNLEREEWTKEQFDASLASADAAYKKQQFQEAARGFYACLVQVIKSVEGIEDSSIVDAPKLIASLKYFWSRFVETSLRISDFGKIQKTGERMLELLSKHPDKELEAVLYAGIGISGRVTESEIPLPRTMVYLLI
eukprot:TRINITY_DN5104_c0_g1_i1.p1 TRINITY_DN5104_c0_g1~~TRINITY_DN5104_c0_g1_i1.p1  ORF type:complete len:211 (-),score=10.79 TRINITY_DN5104_c0_g1_i1:33-665(-)